MKCKYNNILLGLLRSSLLVITIVYIGSACKKQDDWLDVKRSKGDVTPSTLMDFQAMLDNTTYMNSTAPYLGTLSADNLQVADADIASATPAYYRNLYLWKKDVYEANDYVSDWNYLYQWVSYANIILDGLPAITVTPLNQVEYNNIKGAALFLRSYAFYNLAQLFCKPYLQATASADPGILLRVTSDVNDTYQRASVKQTYDRIITDLTEAAALLPVTPVHTTRASAVSAEALLAKAYLVMDNYKDAKTHVNNALAKFSVLLDYNKVITTGRTYSFLAITNGGNPEVIYYVYQSTITLIRPTSSGRINPELYQLYQPGDLRQTLFARSVADGYAFYGSYTGSTTIFAGIGSNELYLIRAECLARESKFTEALDDLNLLLKNRYTPESYQPFTANNETDLLKKIILERRKELPFTGVTPWEDLRRFNKESRFERTLSRVYMGSTYTLPPNDPRYTLPIPPGEIEMSGITQNPR